MKIITLGIACVVITVFAVLGYQTMKGVSKLERTLTVEGQDYNF